MKALVYAGPSNFRIDDRPKPVPGADEILVRPLYSGICFTDKHVYDGLFDMHNPPGGIIGGHEFSAEVVQVGSRSSVRRGDFVAVDPRVFCGECHQCKAGLHTMCVRGPIMRGVVGGLDGGHAEFCIVKDYSVYPITNPLTPLQASYAEPACCATRAVRNCGIAIGDNVLVLGLEDYNLFTIQWLRAAGALNVVAVDPVKARREQALECGATLTVDPAKENVEQALRTVAPFGADVGFVATEDYIETSANYLAQGLASLRVQGTLVVMRTYSNRPYKEIVDYVPWGKEVSIKYFGNFFGEEPWRGGRPRGDWQLTLDALSNGVLRAPIAPTSIIPFSQVRTKNEIDEIFTSIPTATGKIVFDMTA